jgi:hypothetical protein
MLVAPSKNLWLDGLYIRQQTTSRTDTRALMWCNGEDCNLWLTSITLQGDDTYWPYYGGVGVEGGQLFAEGSTLNLVNTFVIQKSHE